MIPIGDDTPRRHFPGVTYLLIAINILVFVVELNSSESFVTTWSFVPYRFTANPPVYFLTILTSLFMHASWLHVLSNMLFLWIFGDNVEDRLGHIGFLAFYLACGIAGTLALYAVGTGSHIIILGASGAIAGVMGAYIVMFPDARIRVLISIFPVRLSAYIVIGIWIVLQVVNSLSSFSGSSAAGGVAYLAHVGGFFFGLIVTFILGKSA